MGWEASALQTRALQLANFLLLQISWSVSWFHFRYDYKLFSKKELISLRLKLLAILKEPEILPDMSDDEMESD